MVKDLLWLKTGRIKFYEKQILCFHHGTLSTQLVNVINTIKKKKTKIDREMEFILQWTKCYLADAECFLSLWRNSYYMILSAGSFEHKIVQWSEKLFSRVWLFATPWTTQSMEFSRPECWSGYPFPSPGDLPNSGTEPRSPALQGDFYQLSHKGSPRTVDWVAYPFSRGSSWSRNWTRISCIAGVFFTNWAIRETIFISHDNYF